MFSNETYRGFLVEVMTNEPGWNDDLNAPTGSGVYAVSLTIGGLSPEKETVFLAMYPNRAFSQGVDVIAAPRGADMVRWLPEELAAIARGTIDRVIVEIDRQIGA